jgi:hypothetical protein
VTDRSGISDIDPCWLVAQEAACLLGNFYHSDDADPAKHTAGFIIIPGWAQGHTMAEYITPQQWLESLDASDRAKADRMIALLERFGAKNPVRWVSSEMRENIPQVARFLFLHQIRSQLINNYSYGGLQEPVPINMRPAEIEAKGEEAYRRLIDSGANQKDIEDVARGEVGRTVWDFICLLDGVLESEYDDIDDAPRWMLAEVTGPIGEGELTGRCLDGLHESFGGLYPIDE